MNAPKWLTACCVIAASAAFVTIVNSGPSDRGDNSAAEMKAAKKQIARSERDDRRVFYTAPPVIPHVVDHRTTAKACLACHASVVQRGDKKSIVTPHPQFYNCQQCHVQGAGTGKDLEVPNSFVGLIEPVDGLRTQPEAPPMIPHRDFLRDNCLSCHGDNSPREYMRTSHPERSNCRQCHVSDSEHQF
jgi:cytochrome c-type protein NapB